MRWRREVFSRALFSFFVCPDMNRPRAYFQTISPLITLSLLASFTALFFLQSLVEGDLQLPFLFFPHIYYPLVPNHVAENVKMWTLIFYLFPLEFW